MNYYSYSGGGVTDTDDLSLGSTLFGEYVITGKSRLRLELGFGDEHQSAGPASTSDRSYEQALLKVNYVPSEKLSFDVGLGVGFQQDSRRRQPERRDAPGLFHHRTVRADRENLGRAALRLRRSGRGAGFLPANPVAAAPQHRRGLLGVPEQRFLHLPDLPEPHDPRCLGNDPAKTLRQA